MQRRLPAIIFLCLTGVLATAQLAKFSTIAPLLRDRFDLSLPEAGLLISLLEVGGDLFGFVAGMALLMLAGVALSEWITARSSRVSV